MTLISRDQYETAYVVLAHFLVIVQRAPVIFSSVGAGRRTLLRCCRCCCAPAAQPPPFHQELHGTAAAAAASQFCFYLYQFRRQEVCV